MELKTFGMINYGEVFKYEGVYYMKVGSANKKYDYGIALISGENKSKYITPGHEVCIGYDCCVELVDAELKIYD